MMLLEHHAKGLLEGRAIPVPAGILATSADSSAPFLPAIVKAQVPTGGRGKSGGIVKVESNVELQEALRRLLSMQIKGHDVRAVRLEQPVEFLAESYISFAVHADSGCVLVMIAPQGGIDIEDPRMRGQIITRLADPSLIAVQSMIEEILVELPNSGRVQLCEAAHALAKCFFDYEALLLEINPVFILGDGHWAAGDVKFVIDENALPRQPAISAIIESNKTFYPEAALKLDQGFDFVVLDRAGDIGLVTTGAGLSMQLVDELTERGHRPYNFCDIRTGGFKGDPARLVQVFRWIADGPAIRSVLMNFFAGMTDLGELAILLIAALEQVPELKRVPITARLIGNGLDEARAVIAAAGNPLAIETDLERAMDRATRNLEVAR